MKFSKTLIQNVLKEWRFYSVDYKAMKKALKSASGDVDHELFFGLYEQSKRKLTKFYNDKEKWALAYYQSMEERVDVLRQTKVSALHSRSEAETNVNTDSSNSVSSSSIVSESEDDADLYVNIEGMSNSFSSRFDMSVVDYDRREPLSKNVENAAWLKEEYRRVGKSKHFHNFIYAKKALDTFARELDLLVEFLGLNLTAFSKILKKYDKVSGSSIRETKLSELEETHAFLRAEKLIELREGVQAMLKQTVNMKPRLPEGWETRKVYTIGCFDLFHRGHQNVLNSLREFGYYIVAGIHDDESYFKLKNKYTIDNLETRMSNVKPFVDQLFVIPSTDPELYLKSMVSEQDILTGQCCYARGDDMLQFPGREWCETVMPVHFVPRTESCSSTLIRTIYHADDPEIRKKAAFADTRYDGKPIDENGNVLKF